MLDEKNFPCLKLAAIIKDSQAQANYILHMAKAVHVDLETVRIFFLVKALPGDSLIQNISEQEIDREYSCYHAPVCTELLKEFPESHSKICCLCRYSSKYANSKIAIEKAILSAILSNPTQESMDKTLILKPGDFKSQFAFIIEDQFYIYPLYQLLFRFIRNSSMPLIIPDNPLLDNISIPNWQRIINTFMTSTTFKKAVNTQALKVTMRDELLIEIANTLLILEPISPSAIDPAQILELNKRRKYVPMQFGTGYLLEDTLPPPEPPSSAKSPAALVAPPPVISNADFSPFGTGITMDNGGLLTAKALEGLCSPLVAPRYKDTSEHFNIEPPKKTEPETPASAHLEEELSKEIPVAPLYDENGLFDITRLYHEHEIIPYSSDMVSGVLYDAYIQKSFVLDCAINDGQPGIVFFVPGYGAPVWGPVENVCFLVKNIVADREIISYTWNLPELVALCGIHGITNFNGLCSLTSVFYASSSEPALYPIDELLIKCGRHIDLSDPRFLIEFLSVYPDLYKELLMEAVKRSGMKGVRLWRAYETALASSIYLWPHFSLERRNLKRLSYNESDYQYTPLIRKLKKGSVIETTITLGSEEESQRYQQDQFLLIHVLGSIFLTSELARYETRLLANTKNELILYVNTKDKHELSCLEDQIALIIAHRFKACHYSPPKITFFRK